MKVRIPKKIAALVGVGAIAAAATGCGADGSSQATAAGTAPQGAQTQSGEHPGGPGMLDTATLAKKLGVTQAKLKAALDSLKPASGQRPQPNEMAAKLAKALGVSQSKVDAALKAVMPQGGPPSGSQAPSGQTPNGASS